MTPSFRHTYCNVYGGPCPGCGQTGFLLTDDGGYSPDAVRTVTHISTNQVTSVCHVPMSLGWLKVSHDGNWWFIPYE